MAQAGMFVPCQKFTFFPYKTICTRILNNDNIYKGQSSFAVECSELDSILRRSDQNTLIQSKMKNVSSVARTAHDR